MHESSRGVGRVSSPGTGASGWTVVGRVDISPADVGRRITTRVQAGTRTVDVVGRLIAWETPGLVDGDTPGRFTGILSVMNRHDITQEISAADLIAARVVAPELSFVAAQRLSRQAEKVSATLELGDWLATHADGTDPRLNSAVVGHDPRCPLPEALRRIDEWFADREAQPIVEVANASVYAGALIDAGWVPSHSAQLWIGTVEDVMNTTGRAPAIMHAGSAANWSLTTVKRGRDPVVVGHELPAPSESDELSPPPKAELERLDDLADRLARLALPETAAVVLHSLAHNHSAASDRANLSYLVRARNSSGEKRPAQTLASH